MEILSWGVGDQHKLHRSLNILTRLRELRQNYLKRRLWKYFRTTTSLYWLFSIKILQLSSRLSLYSRLILLQLHNNHLR